MLWFNRFGATESSLKGIHYVLKAIVYIMPMNRSLVEI